MDFQLLIVRGRSASEALSLVDGVTTVGRHGDCHIRIKSSQVSRRHCELFEKKGMLLVRDLGSANGTYVNGSKVDGQRVLEPGDELTLGGVKLRVAKIGQKPPLKPPAVSSGDTAVVEAVAVAAVGSDDEFEIDFDDEPTAVPDSFAIEVEGEPAPASAPAPSAPKNAAAAPSKKPAERAPVPAATEPEGADEAIADFLLDIKLDEDD